jgi:zinc protease
MAIRFGLSNGLTVVFEAQHAAKVAAFQVWVKAGSADERPDQAGLAHLHEHMLFKGTATRGPGEVAAAIESRGGEINAWTSFDQTVYHTVIASQFAREGLEVLADVVRRSRFDADELAREIEVVCEEIKRSLDAPSRRASRDLFSTAYQAHPYRRPVIGWAETVRSFSREKVLEFYERHYTPKNVVLTATGDLTREQLEQWAEELLGGDWGRPYLGAPPRDREPALEGRRVSLREDELKEGYLNLAFPIPSVSHEDTPALDLLAMIAGQGQSSRLLLDVKRRRSLVNEIHASAYTPKDPGLFVASMTLQPANTEPALEAALAVLADLRESLVPDDELGRVKSLVESDAVYGRETVQGLARKLGFFETTAGGIESEARYYEEIAKVTAANVREIARRYLRFDRCVLTALMPNGTGLSQARLEALLDRARAPKEQPASAAAVFSPAPVRVTAGVAVRKGRTALVEHRLASGARVLVREEGAVPLVAMRAAFLGGLRHETDENNGISALHGRMLTRGTGSLDAEEISRRIDAFAGSLYGNAGRNSVGLRGEFLSRHFDEAFELFSECLLDPRFPERELLRERGLLLQDILTRDDKPASVAFELFARTLFTQHPYRRPILGEQASVESLTPRSLAEYHARFCDPSQLVLAVVGDVQAEHVISLVEARFGKARGATALAEIAPEPPPSQPRSVRRTLAKAQSHLVLGFLGLSLQDPDRYALDVLSTVLSGQGGRLFLELRDKRSMAYTVRSSSLEGLEPGYFAVYMGTSPEKIDAAVEGIRVELAKVRDEPVSEVELARARQHLIGTHEIGLQRNGARAGLLALDTLYGMGLENFAHYAEHIAKVTAADVQRIARRLIDFDRSVQVVVGP